MRIDKFLVYLLLLFGSCAVAQLPQWCDRSSKQARPSSKAVYRVGVLAIRGIDQAYADFNQTFATYLTETAGKQFDPPINFEIVPSLPGLAPDTFRKDVVDFVFVNPSIFSCIESEVGANSLATFISRRQVNGQVYNLEQFGGVIFAKAGNNQVRDIQDIRGKRVGCVSITGLGSGQMQFRALRNKGMHHLQDPKQVLFMSSQNNVVNGVLDGKIDVGFVRTDQLERTIDARTGKLLNISDVKIIGALKNLTQDNGKPFPFTSSTPLYPEWNIASLPHVSDPVAQAVQSSLLRLSRHAEASIETADCVAKTCSKPASDACWALCFGQAQSKNCDTTPRLAEIAYDAKTKGKFAGWRSTLSYMTLRNMQEEINFLNLDSSSGTAKCARSDEIKDAVVCPAGHFKREDDEIANGCKRAGLSCHGFQCLCSPCVKAFEVDFRAEGQHSEACSKFDLCGEVEQSKTIVFRAVDNRDRDFARLSVVVIDGDQSARYEMERVPGKPNHYQFSFHATQRSVGVVILEVYIDETQIPESPFRLEIVPRNCAEETGEPLLIPDEEGTCVCQRHSVRFFGGSCIRLSIILPCVIVPILLLIVGAALKDAHDRQKAADAVWKIDPSEVIFEHPPLVLGHGTFGVVIQGNYRGTKVAIKRALPSKRSRNRKKHLSQSFAFDASDLDIAPRHCDQTEASTQGTTLSDPGCASPRLRWEFAIEMRLLSKIRHPCIATIMGAIDNNGGSPKMIIEYMGLGSLHDVLHNDSMVIEDKYSLSMLRDIASGLRFLHSFDPQIVHGDLMAQNVLVDTSFKAKVTGFGFKRKLRLKYSRPSVWHAPEVIRKETGFTEESDLYSYGMIIYEMYSREEPFQDEVARDACRRVADKEIGLRPNVPRGCPREVAAIMKDCLRSDPFRRPSAEIIDSRLKMVNEKRTEALLHDIFPKHIAAALRSGNKVQPESFDCVTVYFSDIVGYTQIAATLSPTKVTSLLDRLYTKFDRLCSIHNVFKVETVGDAYMVVTNLALRQDNHVQIMASFALDAQTAASETLIDEEHPSLGCVKIRAGFHSGPVAAHVIGTTQPRYSVVGDTVNTASRMESNSRPGRIQCSEESAKHLIKHTNSDLDIICRGNVRIKGKGEMKTFWVRQKIGKLESFSGQIPLTSLTMMDSKDSSFLRRSSMGSLHSQAQHDASSHRSGDLDNASIPSGMMGIVERVLMEQKATVVKFQTPEPIQETESPASSSSEDKYMTPTSRKN